MTVPLLAFLRLGAAVPLGWRALADQHPGWWAPPGTRGGTAGVTVEAAPEAGHTGRPGTGLAGGPTPTARPARPERKTRRSQREVEGQATLDLDDPVPLRGQEASAPPSAAGPGRPGIRVESPVGPLVEALLVSETFEAQYQTTARRLAQTKIHAAVAALLDAGGTLPVSVVGERAGEPPNRAIGFVTTLQRVFNVDNYPVLSIADGGRTVRLDIGLLREQFAIPGGDG